MNRMFFALVFLALLSIPGLASADGCPFMDIQSADLEVKATAQRAVLWQRHGTWEIHITPVFDRARAKTAWVVPFPVLPKVQTSTGDLFNQLELLTAPMFIEVCIPPSRGCDAGAPGGGSDNGGGNGKGAVEIWDQGTVGELDYVLITAQNDVYMVNWLRRNGYHVTDLAEASLKKFEADGTFFFAARLSEDADPAKPVTPVRFVLPDLKTPVYPLVLTGLAVPEGASLELSIWVISPKESYFAPTSHGYGTLPQELKDLEAYESALRRFYLSHRPGTMVMLYNNILAEEERIDKRVCVYSSCVPFSAMGIAAPEKWCAEIDEIVSTTSRVARFQGRLGPVSLRTDLAFGQPPDATTWFRLSNAYLYNACAQEEKPGACGDSD